MASDDDISMVEAPAGTRHQALPRPLLQRFASDASSGLADRPATIDLDWRQQRSEPLRLHLRHVTAFGHTVLGEALFLTQAFLQFSWFS